MENFRPLKQALLYQKAALALVQTGKVKIVATSSHIAALLGKRTS